MNELACRLYPSKQCQPCFPQQQVRVSLRNTIEMIDELVNVQLGPIASPGVS